jgi:hypothetical protein
VGHDFGFHFITAEAQKKGGAIVINVRGANFNNQ